MTTTLKSIRVTLTQLAVILLLPACVVAQAKTGTPKIGTAFAKAGVKALLTIEGTHDPQLLDAAMIDLSAAHSTRAELVVVWHVQLFQQIYALHNLPGGDHYEDQGCIVAWLPKLRALSAEIPGKCPHLTAEEMKAM
jgi:hypothetical protein